MLVPTKTKVTEVRTIALPEANVALSNARHYIAALYRAIYEYTIARSHVAELTIEDPSEAFEDLRDKVDLRMLLSHPTFLEEAYGQSNNHTVLTAGSLGTLGPPTLKQWAEKWRRDLKMASVR